MRAEIEEREYEVVARVSDVDEFGEELPKSERLAAAYRIAGTASRRSRFPARVLEVEGEGISACLHLGDAPDADFEEAAGALMEAASW